MKKITGNEVDTTMLDIHNQLNTPPQGSPPVRAEEATTSVPPDEPRRSWPGRVWHTVKRYPIPVGAFALLTGSLAFWLAGRGDLANWALLAVVLLGGIPLVWETVRQFFHK